MSNLKIRKRTRIDSSPPAGMRQEWVEYQVLDGRKIIARRGSLEECLKEFPKAIPDKSCGSA